MEQRFYTIYNNSDKLESKKLGEVYTPISIAEKMIEHLPENIWNNKNIKVLDFACGTGIFGFFIYKKLIKHFSHQYIVDNILYFNDIQEKNINKIKYIFDNPRNIHCGNFLEWNCNEQFDIIIGNPPYSNLKTNRSNGNSIWHKFVDKLLLLLNDGGYLSLIHPSGWRKPSTEKCKYTHLYKELAHFRQMHYLEIHDSKDGKSVFRCGTRYDIYLVENVKPYKNTAIVDEKGNKCELNLLNWNFLPNHSFELMSDLLSCTGNGIKLIYNRSSYASDKKHVQKQCDEVYKYPIIHSVTKNGVKYRYSSRNDLGHFNVPKIIWSRTNFVNNVLDIDGKYGLSESSVAVQVKNADEGEMIKKCFMTTKFKLFMESMRYGNYSYEFRIFNYLKDGIWKYLYN